MSPFNPDESGHSRINPDGIGKNRSGRKPQVSLEGSDPSRTQDTFFALIHRGEERRMQPYFTVLR